MTNKVDYHENLILAIKLTKNHPKKTKNGAIAQPNINDKS